LVNAKAAQGPIRAGDAGAVMQRLGWIADMPTRLLVWWGSELASLVPAPVRRILVRPRLVVSLEGDGMRVLEERGQEARPLGLARDAADVARLAGGRPAGLRLPLSSCYVRRVLLPAAARRDAAGILALDLERATPFREADVYHAHVIDAASGPPGRIAVRHVIVKRALLDRAVARLEAAGCRVAFADCWSGDEPAAMPIDLLPARAGGAPPHRRRHSLAAALGVLALALAASAPCLLLQRHQSALAAIAEQTRRAKSEAGAQRRASGAAQAADSEMAVLARLKHGRPATVEVIEEITRLLPDTAHLLELRIEGDTVDITGFARSAAGILPLLERSALLADAALSGPLTREPGQDRERFAVRMRLRAAGPAMAKGGKG
jgi:general secretion pathway protein L